MNLLQISLFNQAEPPNYVLLRLQEMPYLIMEFGTTIIGTDKEISELCSTCPLEHDILRLGRAFSAVPRNYGLHPPLLSGSLHLTIRSCPRRFLGNLRGLIFSALLKQADFLEKLAGIV